MNFEQNNHPTRLFGPNLLEYKDYEFSDPIWVFLECESHPEKPDGCGIL